MDYSKTKKILSFCTLLMAGTAVVHAGLLEIVHTEPYENYITDDGDVNTDRLPVGSSHDVEVTKDAIGWYNANLYANEDVDLTFEYLGFEAGWTNSFFVDGSEVFANKGADETPIGSKATSSALTDALINFAFQTVQKNNPDYTATVVNGENVAPIGVAGPFNNGKGAPNFFLGYLNNDASSNTVYITLDDGGGAFWRDGSIDDDNHDDLVIKVTARAVPEPSSIALFGLGLIGLGLARRRV